VQEPGSDTLTDLLWDIPLCEDCRGRGRHPCDLVNGFVNQTRLVRRQAHSTSKLAFMTVIKPALMVCFISFTDLAPEMIAMQARYTADHEFNQQQRGRIAPPRHDAPTVWIGATMRLLASTCASLRPANVRCKRPTRTCPSGADTQKPYAAILNARESTFMTVRAWLRPLADFVVREGTPAR
jgi:hypothetical protein